MRGRSGAFVLEGSNRGTTARPPDLESPLLPAFFARLTLFAALVLAVAPSAAARHFYAAPFGSPNNDGRIDHPLDLVTALSAASPAQPGDTIWLRGGTYWGPFTSTLTGTAALPIRVRQYPTERATLDGALSPTIPTLTVLGAYAMYWGLEITS